MSFDEPEPADVAALLRAHLAGDEARISALLGMVDVGKLFPMTVGFLLQVISNQGMDADTLDAELTRWQRDRLS